MPIIDRRISSSAKKIEVNLVLTYQVNKNT
jgi:hypothetical protein